MLNVHTFVKICSLHSWVKLMKIIVCNYRVLFGVGVNVSASLLRWSIKRCVWLKLIFSLPHVLLVNLNNESVNNSFTITELLHSIGIWLKYKRRRGSCKVGSGFLWLLSRKRTIFLIDLINWTINFLIE